MPITTHLAKILWHKINLLTSVQNFYQKNNLFKYNFLSMYWNESTGVCYQNDSVNRSKRKCFIKTKAAFLAPILPRAMKERDIKMVALILMKNSHVDRTLRYKGKTKRTVRDDIWILTCIDE